MRVTIKVKGVAVWHVPKGISTPIQAAGNLGKRFPRRADETSPRAPGTGCPMQVTIGAEAVNEVMIPKGVVRSDTSEVP
jgi:hypothetical protein